jgi:pantothenate synthetase
MGVATTIAVIAAAAAAGSAVYGGQQQASSQKKALRAQEREQASALARSLSAERQAAEESAKTNARKPDVGALLAADQARNLQGPAATILGGATAQPPGTLKTTTMLGE